MGAKTERIEFGRWVLNVRVPSEPGPHSALVLLHGWTGDETSMWVFGTKLPERSLVLAPRGLFPSSPNGFSWHADGPGAWPQMKDFSFAVESLLELFSDISSCGLPGIAWPKQMDYSSLGLVGFSQGAALAYAFSLLHPERVSRLAGLAGFMPEGAEALAAQQPLREKPVFIAHGRQDEVVPVERARQAVRILQLAGAQVTYCEGNVRHKLDAACFRDVAGFFR